MASHTYGYNETTHDWERINSTNKQLYVRDGDALEQLKAIQNNSLATASLLKELIIETKINNSLLYWSLVQQCDRNVDNVPYQFKDNGEDPLETYNIRQRFKEKTKLD
jgi:hypothetical protein